MKSTRSPVAEIQKRVAKARAELASAQTLVARSPEVVHLLSGPPLEHLNEAVSHLQMFADKLMVRARDTGDDYAG